ncbi:MAG: bacillithiol biosynthesis deacetylase BshB1 [Balneolaceae bacterium]|nr:bacillithiol biosynthesis deacetylase BshB1 [Balneolaceae bacterium]
MDIDVLAFGAHPDDTELSCSGTLAALIKNGRKVAVVDLTRGEMGSRGTPELRKKEAQKAAEILGLHARENIGLPDTELANNRKHQKAIIQKIRQFRPHICLIPTPKDRHPDHENATALLTDAIFYSGLAKIETTGADGKMQKHFRPSHVLHFMQHDHIDPDFVYDITDTIEIKEKAIMAFSSQFNVEDPGDEPETYISDPAFFDALRAKAAYFGQMAGYKFGEGFLYARKPFPLQNFNFLFDTSPKR